MNPAQHLRCRFFAVLAALALWLGAARPCAGHDFLIVDLGVTPSDGGLTVTVATDRHEYALALVRAGLLPARRRLVPSEDCLSDQRGDRRLRSVLGGPTARLSRARTSAGTASPAARW